MPPPRSINIAALFGSFRTKVTSLLIFSLFFVTILSNSLIHKFALESQFNQLRDKLKVIAQTAALMVDPALLAQVPLNSSGANTTPFKIISDQLNKIKRVNPPVESVYVLAKTENEGILQFVVDPEAGARMPGDKTAYPGDKYDATRFPEMLQAFNGPAADKKPMMDEWGITLSGYAPIRDKTGLPIAILGVDISAADVFETQKEMQRRAFIVFGCGIMICIFLGLLMSRWITDPIEKLVEGTRRLAAEDLGFKVEVSGNDEISELAKSFNTMAVSLSESRNRLHDYFYRVVQSLVRMLEAKDFYTRGHSERVADYAEKIALKMGIAPEKADLLKKTAELHDIGKLVIHENILNKTGKLTEEEWLKIKEHPITGEEILKPVLLDKELLVMVRSHHERYDGKGYPDKISGENISLFAQIISVADAYDAMTSTRAYRSTLTKAEAIEELRRNSGTQFNPEIVEIFLKILS